MESIDGQRALVICFSAPNSSFITSNSLTFAEKKRQTRCLSGQRYKKHILDLKRQTGRLKAKGPNQISLGCVLVPRRLISSGLLGAGWKPVICFI